MILDVFTNGLQRLMFVRLGDARHERGRWIGEVGCDGYVEVGEPVVFDGVGFWSFEPPLSIKLARKHRATYFVDSYLFGITEWVRKRIVYFNLVRHIHDDIWPEPC